MSVVFEVKEALVRIYHLQKLPREVRCYGKDIVILAQKFLLPLRTASLLTYLAYSDLLCGKLDDCQVKLNGLSDILCLSDYKSSIPRIQKTVKVDMNKAYDHSTLDVNEVSLDLPQRKHTKQLLPSSPTLVLENFKQPDFIKHDKFCNCFTCICLEYQNLVLLKIHLDALLNVHQDDMNLARSFFSGGIELYKHLRNRKENYRSKVLKLVHNDLIASPEISHLEAYCYLLLDYGNNLLRLKHKKAAAVLNKELIDILSPRKLNLICLYSEVLLQKIHIYHEMPVEEDPDCRLKVDQPQDVNLPKTPESKFSKVTVDLESSPKPCSPPKRVFKNIFFDLTDSEVNVTVIKKDVPGSHLKTPMPSNIKVYAPASKSTRKKKPLLDIPVSEFSESENRVTLANTAFLAPTTPCTKEDRDAEKLKSGLKTRTKLLTQRLQCSDRKESTRIDEDGGAKENKEKSKKITTRRNLFDLPNSESNNPGGSGLASGAVRRSSRRKQ